MLFGRVKSYLNARTAEINFKIHSSWAAEIAYEVMQNNPSAGWHEVVKLSVDRLTKDLSITEQEARSHVVYALRLEGAFVLPPRVMQKQQRLREELEGF
ncbi:hypothetical protein KKE60_08995 [Patescibacteria group bacterium]|nr:hypothetical protein [Patescibacteria group bacterium]